MFDSIQVRFKGRTHIESPFSNTRIVPFVDSYLEILKCVIDDIKTEYFWFFANFVNMENLDLDYIPEQFEKYQMHVWYTTHPQGGLNKEGNAMLIPTKQFKEQLPYLKFLRDFKHIKYIEHSTLFQQPIGRCSFRLRNPFAEYEKIGLFYKWMINSDLSIDTPNFFPSFWDDEKMYTWGDTKDVLLVPGDRKIEQFYDIDRCVHFDLDYHVEPMDIVFLSYDEPSAEKYWNALKEKFPRAKRVKGVKGRTLSYHTAAKMSDTDYFFAVFPTIELHEDFKFDFQPDRMKHPCHYIFHCKNPVNGLEYGHRAVILYNKQMVLQTLHPGLDFTLSKKHTVVPLLCGTSHFNQTPEISWRVAFREVLKLCDSKSTIESCYRLKKWCELGQGRYADYVQRGALDAKEYYEQNKNDKSKLMLSYELDWLKEKFNSIS